MRERLPPTGEATYEGFPVVETRGVLSFEVLSPTEARVTFQNVCYTYRLISRRWMRVGDEQYGDAEVLGTNHRLFLGLGMTLDSIISDVLQSRDFNPEAYRGEAAECERLERERAGMDKEEELPPSYYDEHN